MFLLSPIVFMFEGLGTKLYPTIRQSLQSLRSFCTIPHTVCPMWSIVQSTLDKGDTLFRGPYISTHITLPTRIHIPHIHYSHVIPNTHLAIDPVQTVIPYKIIDCHVSLCLPWRRSSGFCRPKQIFHIVGQGYTHPLVTTSVLAPDHTSIPHVRPTCFLFVSYRTLFITTQWSAVSLVVVLKQRLSFSELV